jgi:hypothetical protein
MNDTLKAAGRIGAELGAAKAENEKLRQALKRIIDRCEAFVDDEAEMRTPSVEVLMGIAEDAIYTVHLADAALSQQAEPVCPFCGEPSDHCNQSFPHPSKPAPAKDETEPVYQFQWREIGEGDWMACSHSWFRFCEASPEHDTRVVEVARPAQTEQQPVCWASSTALAKLRNGRNNSPCVLTDGPAELNDTPLYAAPIAQTAPQGKFRMGDLVKKSTGSEWEGRVVGTYSTEQTKEGYAVESSAHRNSVQIYPAKALELVPMAAKEA